MLSKLPTDEHSGFILVLTLWVSGLVTGLGVLLASKETLTLRIVFGRALSSGALGLSSLAVLALIPDLPKGALVGIACVLASLGTSGLERALQIWRGKV